MTCVEGGSPVLVVDARPSATRQRDGVIPGAVPIEAILHGTDERFRGGEAVVYRACPNEATAARVARRLVNLGFHPVRPRPAGSTPGRTQGSRSYFPNRRQVQGADVAPARASPSAAGRQAGDQVWASGRQPTLAPGAACRSGDVPAGTWFLRGPILVTMLSSVGGSGLARVHR